MKHMNRTLTHPHRATKLGVDARYLLELTNRADLSRIKGVGKVYADVLETAHTISDALNGVPLKPSPKRKSTPRSRV